MTPRRVPSAETLLRAGLWSVLFAVIAFTRADPDLWGHVRFGLDMLRDGSIPRADPYSFTSDREWVNHEWAAEVMIGAAFRGAGNAGIVLLKLLLMGASLLLLDRTLRQEGVVEGRRRDWMGAAAVITTVQQAHHMRPQLFSLFFFAALMSCLMRESERHDRRWLLVVPVLFAVWPNFHGGWIVGGAALILWTLGLLVSVRSNGIQPALRFAAVGAASLAATLVNPYGAGLWRFLSETVGLGRRDITDWQPVYALDPSIWGLWCATTALAVVGCFRARRPVRPERVIVLAAFAAASFLVNRLLGFFALATVFLFGAEIVGQLHVRAEAAPVTGRRPGRTGPTAIAVIMMTGALVAVAVNVVCVRIDPRMTPEPEAVAYLKDHASGGRLLVWFDWGEYAIWHLGPALRVSVDGRRETVYSASVQDRHLRFFFDAPGGAALPRQLAADYVWIPRQLPAIRRLRDDGWALLYEGQQSAIFGRARDARAAAQARTAPARARCFPGP